MLAKPLTPPINYSLEQSVFPGKAKTDAVNVVKPNKNSN